MRKKRVSDTTQNISSEIVSLSPINFTWRKNSTQSSSGLFNDELSKELGIKVSFRDYFPENVITFRKVAKRSDRLIKEYSSKSTPKVDAPQVILHQNQPIFIKDQKFLSPFFFSSSVYNEQNLKIVLNQIKMASESGVCTFAHLIDLKVDLQNIDEMVTYTVFLIKKTVEVCAEANILLRLVVLAPENWKQRYPLSDNRLKEPSFCDEAFWSDTETVLTHYIQALQKTDYYRHVIGVHLERGEWFMPKDMIDTSQAAQTMFKEWVKIRYDNDLATLRAAWFDGKICFDSVVVPIYEKGDKLEQLVHTSRRTRKYVDYSLFISDQMVSKIRQLAGVVKKITQGNLLVGVSYGYSFEWSHPTNGHLSLGKLLRSKDIDFITAPSSYKSRKPSQTGAFPCPIDSFRLNGKLFLSEEDFKTPISHSKLEPDEFNPLIKNPLDLEQVHWRGVGAALAHGSGLIWMDTWGNGWLDNPRPWKKSEKILEQLRLRVQHLPSDPEVIVFLDERSLACLVDQKAFELLVQNSREAVLRSGTQVGFYLLSDLAHREKFPDAKLYIFLNAWDMRSEVRIAIKNKLHKDGKVLFWLYTAGLFESGREALDHVKEVTGLVLKPQPFASVSGSQLVHGKHPLTQALNNIDITNTQLFSSSYYALPEVGSTVLAEYTHTGLPSLIVKDFSNIEEANSGWSSVFWGEPLLTSELIRALAQMAKVHIWSDSNDLVYYNHPFLTVHCTNSGSKTVVLPSKLSAYQIQTSEWVLDNGYQIKFDGLSGHTYIFLIGIKSEIEGFLEEGKKESSLLNLLSPPYSTEEEDSEIHFDVPIMRLNQWIEEGYNEITKSILFNNDEEDISDQDMDLENDAGLLYKKQSQFNTNKKKKGDNHSSNPKVNVTFRKKT